MKTYYVIFKDGEQRMFLAKDYSDAELKILMCGIESDEIFEIADMDELTIWKMLKDNDPIVELDGHMEYNLQKAFLEVKDRLKSSFEMWKLIADKVLQNATTFEDRSDQEYYIKQFSCKDIVFDMLDQKDYSKKIWKRIKPKKNQTLKYE